MNTDRLREAASLMRERAKITTPGSWFAVDGAVYTGTAAPHQVIVPCVTYYDDTDHIASWSPQVALAVAEWLEHSATVIDGLNQVGSSVVVPPGCYAVADAYLGDRS